MIKTLIMAFAAFCVLQARIANAADAAAGKAKYDANCTICHGATGKADTPAAEKLNPKPSALAGSKTSDEIMKTIIGKGGAVAGKSPIMIAFSSKLSDADIDNIIAYIRTFK